MNHAPAARLQLPPLEALASGAQMALVCCFWRPSARLLQRSPVGPVVVEPTSRSVLSVLLSLDSVFLA